MILKSEPPHDFLRAYQDQIADFVDFGGPAYSVLVERAEAHEVHNLGVAKIAAGPSQSLNGLTTPAGWRFLASGNGFQGAFHVGALGTGALPKVTGFSGQPDIAGLFEFVHRLGDLPDLASGHYTLRALRIPWLKMEAFWLAGTDGEEFAVPFSGFPEAAGLQRGSVYSAPDFLQTVQGRTKTIRERIAMSRAGKVRIWADFK